MPKIKALIRLENDDKTDEFKTTAIIHDNLLKYKEKDNTTMIIDLEKNIIIRENNELKIEFPLSLSHKTKGSIYLKEFDKKLTVEITTKKIEKNNNDIEIQYKIEKQLFKYYMEEIK